MAEAAPKPVVVRNFLRDRELGIEINIRVIGNGMRGSKQGQEGISKEIPGTLTPILPEWLAFRKTFV
jgi:hypothetical protein